MVLHVLDTDDVKQKNKNHETIPKSIFLYEKNNFCHPVTLARFSIKMLKIIF